METPHIVICAPSGAGKTTIVKELMKLYPDHRFSVSATTRKKRGEEVDGKDYYFLDKRTFLRKKEKGEFIECEEVYGGSFYGTLKSEIERIEKEGKRVIFDVDVKGAESLKKFFRDKAVSIFIMPPSFEILEERLKNRKTETKSKLKERLLKAKVEMMPSSSKFCDGVVINDDLAFAVNECVEAIQGHIVSSTV